MSQIVTLRPESFPSLLREIPEVPKSLYMRGALPSDDRKFLAVVGSRKYSQYGKDACRKLIAGLSGYPVVVVSGLALGIDGIAHEAALEAGLATVAVPGSGLAEHSLYPASHAGLARRIVENGGALVSEYAPDFKATPWSFPERNRIMAGLSHAVLVVEAGLPSGTLITARLAVEYNRDVLAVPGSIFSGGSTGANNLLRQGAAAALESADILRVLGIPVRESRSSENALARCTPEERRVLSILSEPYSRDRLIDELSLDIRAVNILLSAMEVKGLIAESGGFVHRT